MANVLFPNANSQKVMSLWGAGYQSLVDEGAVFLATNPTMGTAIATTTSITSEDQTKPVLVLANTASASDPNAKTIYPKYLNMLLSQVPTSATDWQMSIRMDNNTSVYTSGGSSITPVNANSGSSITSKSALYFGAVVAVTTNSQGRLVCRRQLNSAVPVTKDQWFFGFGEGILSSDQIAGGSGAKNVTFSLPGLAIAPGWNMRIQMWGGSNAAAPSWEFEMGWVERLAGL